MNEEEKRLAQTIAAVVNFLPDENRKLIIGYAMGVRDAYAAIQQAGQPSE